MSLEERQEALDVCLAAWEKHGHEPERCPHAIRDGLAKLMPGVWNVVVGPAFAYCVHHQVWDGMWEVGLGVRNHRHVICR